MNSPLNKNPFSPISQILHKSINYSLLNLTILLV
jgi:hypothetical protein